MNGSLYINRLLFHFEVQNIGAVLLALLPAVLNLIIFIYIIIFMPRKATSQLFALFTFSLFLWQIDDTMARILPMRDQFAIWDNILSIGWICTGSLGLIFALHYTGKRKFLKSNSSLLLLLFPTLFFEITFKAGLYDHIYIKHPVWGWIDNHNTATLDIAMIDWIVIQVLAMMVLLVRHAWRMRHNKPARTQAIIIAFGIGIPALQGITTQAIVPIVFHITSIPVTSTFLTIFSVSTLIALNRYQLFNLREAISTESLLDSMSDIVFTLSPGGQILYANPIAMNRFGFNAEDIDSIGLEKLFADQRMFAAFKENVIKPVFKGHYTEKFYSKFKTANGEDIYVLISADPVVERKQVIGALILAHDITSLKEAEEEIRIKNIELERSNEDLESYAFVASHDMKEPLRMVSNYTQLIAKKYEDKLDDEGKEFIRFAVEGVHRIQNLINDLLLYARIGRQQMTKSAVDLNEVIAEVVQNLSTEIQNKKAVINIPTLPTVKGFKSLLIQVFQNLIENAIKFQGAGVQPVVDISYENTENGYKFSVKDNGIGIDEVYKDKIFVIFQRLHEKNKYPGTGIGLSVAKKIVELHGGRIWIDSSPGKGTTFNFKITNL